MKKRLLSMALTGFFCFSLLAQKPDSLRTLSDSIVPPPVLIATGDTVVNAADLVADSTILKAKKQGVVRRFFTKKYPNPRTAALLSLVVPGAGQAYNKKWWKVPIVWGALGGIGYFTFDTQKTYRELRTAYKNIVDDDPATVPASPYDNFDASQAKTYRDQFKRYTEQWYVALGVTYLLATTDAFVDAHLTRFDVSDDLSLRLRPAMESAPGLPAFGLGISLQLDASATKTHNHFRP